MVCCMHSAAKLGRSEVSPCKRRNKVQRRVFQFQQCTDNDMLMHSAANMGDPKSALERRNKVQRFSALDS